MIAKPRYLLVFLLLSVNSLLQGQLPYADDFANGDFSQGIGEDLMPIDWYIQKDSSDNVLAGTQIVVNEGETPVDGSSTYVSLVKDQESMKIALASPAIPDPGFGVVEVTFYAKSAEEVHLNLNLLPEPWPAKLNYSSTGWDLTTEWSQYTATSTLPFGNHPDLRWFLDYIHDTDVGTADITGIEIRFLNTYPSDQLENGNFINGTTVGKLPVDWYIQEDTTDDVLFGDNIFVSTGETPNPEVLNYLTLAPPAAESIVSLGSTAFPVPSSNVVDMQLYTRSVSGENVIVGLYEFSTEGAVLLDQVEVTPGADWTEFQFNLEASSVSSAEALVFVVFSVTGRTDPVDIANVKVLNEQQSGSDVLNPVIDPVIQHDWPMIDEISYEKYWALRTAMPDLGDSVPAASDFATVYYIDPTVEQSGDGLSPESPFKSWSEVTIESGSAYLQKCGTTEVLSERIFTKNNVLVGAYGEGPRPVIEVTQSLGNDNAAIHADYTNVTVRDLNIKAPNLAACIKLGNGNNITVYNNVLQDSLWGIRGYASNYRIYGNIIHNHQDDGIFLLSASGLDIGWNYIFHVNTDWVAPYTSQDVASGDSIQLESCTDWNVHHNVLDRTSSGNKFALISNDGSGTCIVEGNYLAGPLSTNGGGSALYFGGVQTSVDVLYNHFDRTITGIYSHAPDISVVGNLFTNSNGGFYSSNASTKMHHNVFYNIAKALIQNGGEVVNNILDNRKGSVNLVQNSTVLQYNIFMGSKKGDNTNIQADPGFIDPERGNFRLSSGSPAIDAGIPGIVNFDRDGFPIPQGTNPDIGAYEYHGGIDIPWTVIYNDYQNGWKLTPHGYAYDGSFPWVLRLPVIGDNKGIGQWFYVLESSITESGFFAYDDLLQSWILVALPVSPWVYVYSDSPDWQLWN